MKKSVEKILQYVQKPARYVGGELNSIVKDPQKIDIRYAFCFPDIRDRNEPPRYENSLFSC